MMNRFNKLYNIILESIITQNKASRAKLLAVVPHNAKIIKFLDSLNNNKLADLLATFFHYGQLEDIKDYRIQQVKEVLAKVSNIDIQKENDLETFLQKYQKIIAKKELKDSVLDLDKIPEFSQKKKYKKGVVIYRVEDSKAGQAAVRKIVDAHWGVDANPWCLITRKRGQNAWAYWKGYSAYPKHIAFQNGKLLAFCANDQEWPAWWDRQDDWSEYLILKDGTELETRAYKWSSEQKRKMYIQNEGLEYNQQTGRYDAYGDINIKNSDLINKQLPVPFGQVDGSFDDSEVTEKVSIKNFPTYINDRNILEADWFGAYFGPYNCYKERAKELETYFKSLQQEYKKRHNKRRR